MLDSAQTLSTLTEQVRRVSLHSSRPPFGEASGNGYARQPIVWTVDGDASNRDELRFAVRAGRYNHVGYWTADGDLFGWDDINEQFMPVPGVVKIEAGRLRWVARNAY